MHQNFNQHPHLVQKISGRWSQQEKRAFEEGLKIHGRGRWVLFLPIIPTKTQLQIRQHAYAFFKKRRLQAQRQLKRDRGDPETSESESESESDSGSDNDTDRGSNSPSTAENSGQDDGSTPFHKKRKKKKRRKKNKDGKKRRAMWTEDEHRLFLDGYKAHPRDWSYLAKIVTSKTPTQIRTHAYSVFQRRRRVGTPLPSGFENMDHSWQQRQVDAAEAAKANLHSRFNNGLGVSATQLSYSKQHHYQPPHNQMQQRQQQQQRQQYQRHQQQLQQQQQRQQQQRQRQQYQSSSPQYDLPSSPVVNQ